jgi:hypothetical protein
VIGTWDDHDFGLNDAGKELEGKQTSQKLMLDFLDEPLDSPRYIIRYQALPEIELRILHFSYRMHLRSVMAVCTGYICVSCWNMVTEYWKVRCL